MLWPLVIVVVVGVVLTAALLAGPRLFPGTRGTTRTFWCPFRGHTVSVDFEEMVWDGARTAVKRCTFFTPPTAVDCHQRCRELTHLSVPRTMPIGG